MATFRKATTTKVEAKARVTIMGPSGSGKTYSALAIADGLGSKIAVIDTEHGSASRYADVFDFSVLELETFSPKTYVKAIRLAEKEGFDVLIIDSLSHAWNGKGGALELVNKAERRYSGNSFAAWRDVTPLHRELIDAMIRCSCHLIATMRTKTEYIIQEDGRGKKVPRKVGTAPVQRDGIEYEFDIVANMDLDHNFIVEKSRCRDLDGEVINCPDRSLGERIISWLVGQGTSTGDKEEAAPQPSSRPPLHEVIISRVQSIYGRKAQDVAQVLQQLHGELAEVPEETLAPLLDELDAADAEGEKWSYYNTLRVDAGLEEDWKVPAWKDALTPLGQAAKQYQLNQESKRLIRDEICRLYAEEIGTDIPDSIRRIPPAPLRSIVTDIVNGPLSEAGSAAEYIVQLAKQGDDDDPDDDGPGGGARNGEIEGDDGEAALEAIDVAETESDHHASIRTATFRMLYGSLDHRRRQTGLSKPRLKAALHGELYRLASAHLRGKVTTTRQIPAPLLNRLSVQLVEQVADIGLEAALELWASDESFQAAA